MVGSVPVDGKPIDFPDFDGFNFEDFVGEVDFKGLRDKISDFVEDKLDDFDGVKFFGGDKFDFLLGGKKGDFIKGGDKDDFVKGGDGDDVISGGKGDNILEGGKGKDIFELEFFDKGFSNKIADFTPGEDKIRIKGVGPDADVNYDKNTGKLWVDGDEIAQVDPNMNLDDNDWEIF